MPWLYIQSTGEFFTPEGHWIETGYSGSFERNSSGDFLYRENPDAETIKDKGPIPRGLWKIGGYTGTKGPLTITLTPLGHNAHGRTDFRIHGDSRSNPGQASEGCIILGPTTRQKVVNSRDKLLHVVRDPESLIKPWTFVLQNGGLYTPDGFKIATGISGSTEQPSSSRFSYKNNEALSAIPYKGSIPCGLWKMGSSSFAHGAMTIPLEPVRHNAHGRNNFCIHGKESGGRTTAEVRGGIVLADNIRRQLADSNVRYLKVTRSHYGIESNNA